MQAHLEETQTERHEYTNEQQSKRVERWYGPAVVIGHEWAQEQHKASYWTSYGGHCILATGRHLRPAELEESMPPTAYLKDIQNSMGQAAKEEMSYLILEEATSPENGMRKNGRHDFIHQKRRKNLLCLR